MRGSNKPVWAVEDGVVYDGPFRANIGAFLGHFGTPIPLSHSVLRAYTVEVKDDRQNNTKPTRLYVYEDIAVPEAPPVCDHCRIIGWQQQPVGTQRFHFIFPSDLSHPPHTEMLEEAGAKGATQDPDMAQDQYSTSSAFDSPAHLLHGILHMNGFGHLLRINGLEGGSTHLTGRRIMEIWDKLCLMLRARKVSVEDVSNKAGMELRVLHAVAHQATWYGAWGYEFGRAPFNINKTTWRATLRNVHSLAVDAIFSDFKAHTEDAVLLEIIDRYQVSFPGEPDPTNLGRFLQRMLFLLSRPHAAAAILGVDFPPPDQGIKPRPKVQPGLTLPNHRSGRKSSAAQPETVPALAVRETPAASVKNEALTEIANTVTDAGSQEWHAASQLDRRPKKRQRSSLGQSPSVRQQMLPIRHSSLKPLNTAALNARFPPELVEKGVDSILGLLKANPGEWKRRTSLKAAVMGPLKDGILADACLRCLSNSIVGEWAVYKQLDSSSKAAYFLLESVDKEDRLHPVFQPHLLNPIDQASSLPVVQPSEAQERPPLDEAMDSVAPQSRAGTPPLGKGAEPVSTESQAGHDATAVNTDPGAIATDGVELRHSEQPHGVPEPDSAPELKPTHNEVVSGSQMPGGQVMNSTNWQGDTVVTQPEQDAEEQVQEEVGDALNSKATEGGLARDPALSQQPRNGDSGPAASGGLGGAGVPPPQKEACAVAPRETVDGPVDPNAEQLTGLQNGVEADADKRVHKRKRDSLTADAGQTEREGTQGALEVENEANEAEDELPSMPNGRARSAARMQSQRGRGRGVGKKAAPVPGRRGRRGRERAYHPPSAGRGRQRQGVPADEPSLAQSKQFHDASLGAALPGSTAGSQQEERSAVDGDPAVATPGESVAGISLNGSDNSALEARQPDIAEKQKCEDLPDAPARHAGSKEGPVQKDGDLQSMSEASHGKPFLVKTAPIPSRDIKEPTNEVLAAAGHPASNSGREQLQGSWAVKSQRSARGAPSPLKPSRAAVWGSQSNLLGPLQEATRAQPGSRPHAVVTEAIQEATQARSDLESCAQDAEAMTQEVIVPPLGSLEPSAAPATCMQQGLPAGGLWDLQEANSPQEPKVGLAAESGEAAKGQQGLANGPLVSSTPSTAASAGDQSSSHAQPAEPGGGQSSEAVGTSRSRDAFARPLQALISTVARVGITPTAGTMLATAPGRSRRLSRATATAADRMPLLEQDTAGDAHAQAGNDQATPNGAVWGTQTPGSIDDLWMPKQGSRERKPATGKIAFGSSGLVLPHSVPPAQPQNHWKSPLLPAVQEKLNGKRLRRAPNSLKSSGYSREITPQTLPRRASTGALGKIKRQRAGGAPRGNGLQSNLSMPAKKPWQLLQPGAPFVNMEGFEPRDQVLCDLVYFFNSVMRCYLPAVTTGLIPPALTPAPNSLPASIRVAAPQVEQQGHQHSARKTPAVLRAPRLVEQIAILRDTKHFVKDYQGNSLAPGAMPLGTTLRLLCQLNPLDFVSPGDSSSGLAVPGKAENAAQVLAHRKPKVRVAKRRRVVHPPPELVILPASATLKALQEAIQAAFSSVYYMFSNIQIESIEGVAAKKPSSKIGKLPVDSLLRIACTNAEKESCWHHAGGEEDWQVSCLCGCKDDDGERMVACDCCGLWMHLRCQGIPDCTPSPEEFICAKCKTKGGLKAAAKPEALPQQDVLEPE